MRNKQFIRQLRYDIVIGTRKNKIKYCILFLAVSFICMMFYSSVSKILVSCNGNFIDCYIYIFKGMPIYIFSDKNTFQFPIMWITLQSVIAFFIMGYPTEDLYSYGTQILIRSKNRCMWWCSKCLWVIYTVTTIYILIVLVIVIFTFIFGEFSLIPQKETSLLLNEMDLDYIEVNYIFYLSIFLLPFITSLALSLLQMIISFLLNPIFSYLIFVCIIVSSAYFYNPLLIGNYSMILRSNIIDNRGYDFTIGTIINLCVIIVSIVVGKVYFNKYDILKKD